MGARDRPSGATSSAAKKTGEVAKETGKSVRAVRLRLITVVWIAGPLVYGLGWCLRVFPGHKKAQHWDQWAMANFYSHGALFWFWLFACLFVSLIVILATARRGNNSGRRILKTLPARPGAGTFITALITAVLAIVSFAQFIRVVHNDTLDPDRYYGQSTVLYMSGLNETDAPSLARLLPELKAGGGPRCDLVGATGLPACVGQETLPTTGWDPRVSSLNGAIYAIERSSGTMQNVSLNASTVTYLNTWHGQPARWSGVLDGTGNGTGLGGVSEWNGKQITTCSFTGQYAIGRSFGGSGMSDLPDLLAQTYPGLQWDISDVWGYCDGSQPVVIIPMIRQIYWANRTVDTAGGIVKVQGDYGRTVLTYQASVQPGEYPGPVYPKSIVDTQVGQVSWIAGRRPHDSYNFGYEDVSSAVQAGNVSDYLLRDTQTGRLEWVTPLTLNGSSSELIIAYAISSADQVTNGELNQLSIYVLGPNDPRQVNIDSLEAQARTYFAQQVPGFISSGGQLLEFTPLGGNMWRAYGEVDGRVQYLLDFDATNAVAPRLTNVSPTPGSSPSGTTGAAGSSLAGVDCNKPAQLTTSEIAACIANLAQYLAQHPSATSTSPTH